MTSRSQERGHEERSREGDFAEGQETVEHHPENDHDGDFAEGQDRKDRRGVGYAGPLSGHGTGRARHDAWPLRRSDPSCGGGGTGGALAHDLALRGLKVTLVERGEFTSGTTGRHHGLLHSGARYAVNDQESAVECIEENRLLRKIAPGSFEENDGLFVAITDEDMATCRRSSRGARASDIPAAAAHARQALRLEPMLNPDMQAAVRVPDATMDAMRMPLRFFATAKRNGASLLNYMEVTGLLIA